MTNGNYRRTIVSKAMDENMTFMELCNELKHYWKDEKKKRNKTEEDYLLKGL